VSISEHFPVVRGERVSILFAEIIMDPEDLWINIKNDETIKVMKFRGGYYFTVGGYAYADHDCRPDAVVLKAPNNKIVLNGHLFRNPQEWPGGPAGLTEDQTGVWGAWFNARPLHKNLNKKYSVAVLEYDPGGGGERTLVERTGLTLELVDPPKANLKAAPMPREKGRPDFSLGITIVGVSAPSADVPRGTIAPYGTFGPDDTKIVRVHLVNETGIIATDTNPYYTKSGFWSATMTVNSPKVNVRVLALGDATSAYGPLFNIT
jgi:hypothetical protein